MITFPPSQPIERGLHTALPARDIWFHADDLGGTSTATARLLDAWERGLLDGLSVFGNCDHPNEISDRLAAAPDRPARLSAHLNLWEGRPVSPVADVPRLIDRTGHLAQSFVGVLSRVRAGRPSRRRTAYLAEIEREWRAQIEAVLAMIAPRPLVALDSHLHMHMIPALFTIAVGLARELGVPEIRIVREPFYRSHSETEVRSKRFLVNSVKRELLWRFAAVAAPVAAAAGLASPDRMIGVLYSGMMSRANISRGIAAARRQRARRIEVLVHVGRAAPSELTRWNGDRSKASFAMSPARDVELEELTLMRGDRSAVWHDRRAS